MPRNKLKNIRTSFPRISSFIKKEPIFIPSDNVKKEEKIQENIVNKTENVLKDNNKVKKENKNDNSGENTASK